jgi:carboxylesterase
MIAKPAFSSAIKASGALGLLLAAFTLWNCEINPVECDLECQQGFMDGGLFPDHCSDAADSTCLVSRRFPAPSDSEKVKNHIIIAVHGFTASTFEWDEFARFAENDTAAHGKIRVSKVLMGGHGLILDAFQSSTWKDWGAPILAEFDSLKHKGYRNISFACASTGCTLLMQYIAEGVLDTGLAPKWVYMIDPIVVPTTKLLSLVNLVGPIVGSSPNPGSDEENKHWYVNRPQEDLQELYELTNRVKNKLESGFELPKKTNCKVYKSKHDNSADPVGALLIYKGMRKSDGSHIEAEMFDSRLHVMTRLAGREPAPSHADTLIQASIFNEMIKKDLAVP